MRQIVGKDILRIDGITDARIVSSAVVRGISAIFRQYLHCYRLQLVELTFQHSERSANSGRYRGIQYPKPVAWSKWPMTSWGQSGSTCFARLRCCSNHLSTVRIPGNTIEGCNPGDDADA